MYLYTVFKAALLHSSRVPDLDLTKNIFENKMAAIQRPSTKVILVLPAEQDRVNVKGYL